MEICGEGSKINPHIFAKQNAWKIFSVKNRQILPFSLIKDYFDILVFLFLMVKVNIPKYLVTHMWLC